MDSKQRIGGWGKNRMQKNRAYSSYRQQKAKSLGKLGTFVKEQGMEKGSRKAGRPWSEQCIRTDLENKLRVIEFHEHTLRIV